MATIGVESERNDDEIRERRLRIATLSRRSDSHVAIRLRRHEVRERV